MLLLWPKIRGTIPKNKKHLLVLTVLRPRPFCLSDLTWSPRPGPEHSGALRGLAPLTHSGHHHPHQDTTLFQVKLQYKSPVFCPCEQMATWTPLLIGKSGAPMTLSWSSIPGFHSFLTALLLHTHSFFTLENRQSGFIATNKGSESARPRLCHWQAEHCTSLSEPPAPSVASG